MRLKENLVATLTTFSDPQEIFHFCQFHPEMEAVRPPWPHVSETPHPPSHCLLILFVHHWSIRLCGRNIHRLTRESHTQQANSLDPGRDWRPEWGSWWYWRFCILCSPAPLDTAPRESEEAGCILFSLLYFCHMGFTLMTVFESGILCRTLRLSCREFSALGQSVENWVLYRHSGQPALGERSGADHKYREQNYHTIIHHQQIYKGFIDNKITYWISLFWMWNVHDVIWAKPQDRRRQERRRNHIVLAAILKTQNWRPVNRPWGSGITSE